MKRPIKVSISCTQEKGNWIEVVLSNDAKITDIIPALKEFFSVEVHNYPQPIESKECRGCYTKLTKVKFGKEINYVCYNPNCVNPEWRRNVHTPSQPEESKDWEANGGTGSQLNGCGCDSVLKCLAHTTQKESKGCEHEFDTVTVEISRCNKCTKIVKGEPTSSFRIPSQPEEWEDLGFSPFTPEDLASALATAKLQARHDLIQELEREVRERMELEKRRAENAKSEKEYKRGKYIGLRYALDILEKARCK